MANPNFLDDLKTYLADAGDMAEAVGIALDRIQTWKLYFWTGVYRIEAKQAKLVDFRGPVPPTQELKSGEGSVGQVVKTGVLKRSPDVRKDVAYAESFGLAETRSELALPIFHPKDKKRVIAVMSVQSDDLNYFAEDDERVLAKVCDMLAPLLSLNEGEK